MTNEAEEPLPIPQPGLHVVIADDELNDLATLIRRGLNTWDDAPKWLFDLSDAVDKRLETIRCSSN